jgi:hypothetical protein
MAILALKNDEADRLLVLRSTVKRETAQIAC